MSWIRRGQRGPCSGRCVVDGPRERSRCLVNLGGLVNEVLTEQDLLGYFESLSNWYRWGSADSLGTLNHITEEKRKPAAAMIVRGRTVSCARAIVTGAQVNDFDGVSPQRYMLASGDGLGPAN